MTRVGITGHQRLAAEAEFGAEKAWSWVREQLDHALGEVEPPLIGLSSLAAGADQLFAQLVLERRGALEIVLPFHGYQERLAAEARARFDALRKRGRVTWLLETTPADEAGRARAYFLAGKAIVDGSDRLLAVWEGPTGKATDKIVEYARLRARPLTIIDPLRREVGPLRR